MNKLLYSHGFSGMAIALMLACALPMAAIAAPAPSMLSNDQPVQLSADALQVLQDQKQAIFSGNVIASQGNIHMRADKMVVHYNKAEGKTENPAPAQGVSRIDAEGHVVFTNPTDTAKGDVAIYDVEKKTLDLSGTVILTREQNILKGTHLHYDMQTGRSLLTAGKTAVSAGGGNAGNGRVQGLFVPNATPNAAPKVKP